MDFSRLRTGELLAGLGGIALFAVMFLDWFGVSSLGVTQQVPTGIPGAIEAPTTGVDAWDAFEFTNFVFLLTAVAGIGLAIISAAGRRVNIPVTKGVTADVLGSVSALLIIWRIFDPPFDGDLEIGVFLGLAAALAVSLGGYLTARAEGFDFYAPAKGARSSGASRSSSGSTARKRATSSRSSTAKRSTTRKK